MSRKPKKGYFVRGQFVAEGSELDLELKRELKGTDEASRTDLKRESDELQKLGEELLGLRAALFDALPLAKSSSTPSPRPSASPISRASAARCSSSAS
jgi:ribosome-associated protein